MSNDPLSSEPHDRLPAVERSIVDWLSADDELDLAPEPLNLSLQPPEKDSPARNLR